MSMKRSASDDELESTPSPKKPRGKNPSGGAAFDDERKAILLQAMIDLILVNRTALYGTPGLEGVKENGGDRINKRILIMLKEWEKQNGGAGNYAAEAVKKIKKTK